MNIYCALPSAILIFVHCKHEGHAKPDVDFVDVSMSVDILSTGPDDRLVKKVLRRTNPGCLESVDLSYARRLTDSTVQVIGWYTNKDG